MVNVTYHVTTIICFSLEEVTGLLLESTVDISVSAAVSLFDRSQGTNFLP